MAQKKTIQNLWRPRRRIEAMYRRSLKLVMKELQKDIDSLTDTKEILKAIRKFASSIAFEKYAHATAMKMVTHLFSDAGRTWREAARENGKGRIIYEALKKEMQGPIGGAIVEQVQRNAEIIKSMPLSISKDITEHVMKESLRGKRHSDIAKELGKMIPEMSDKKANLIARTEVSKTSTALTKARSENLGINWYRWRTSEDQRVRNSHSHMEDVLINWNDPPSPEALIHEKNVGYYHAGNIYNCRCYPEALVTLDFIKWPHKVYYQGKIQSMTRKQFESIM